MSDELKDEKPNIVKRTGKPREKKTPLDLIVEQILSEKKEKDYTIAKYTDEDYKYLSEIAKDEWNNSLSEEEKMGFDMDEIIYKIMRLIIFSFEYELSQKQVLYNVNMYKMGGKIINSVSYKNYISYEDRISEGYFTKDEMNRIIPEMNGLMNAIRKKYLPSEFAGPYSPEEIDTAISVGMAMAFNTYNPFNKNMKMSFSTWAYTIMDNKCKDVLRHYSYAGRGSVALFSLEDEVNKEEHTTPDKENTLDSLLVNERTADVEDTVDNEARKQFLTDVFNKMREGNENKKSINQQIYVMQLYFGYISGQQETAASVARVTGLSISKVKTLIKNGKMNVLKAVAELGYSPEDVLELFL